MKFQSKQNYQTPIVRQAWPLMMVLPVYFHRLNMTVGKEKKYFVKILFKFISAQNLKAAKPIKKVNFVTLAYKI